MPVNVTPQEGPMAINITMWKFIATLRHEVGPLTVRAQQPGRVCRTGVLVLTAADDLTFSD
jgi:hypothetical protein